VLAFHSPRQARAVRAAVLLRCGIGGSWPGARANSEGPRQCLRVDVLLDVRHFAISNGNVEDPLVLERPIRRLISRSDRR